MSASIETAALHQPTAPTELYINPHDIKGVIRYLTPSQDHIYSFAKPIMLGSFFIYSVVFILCLWKENGVKDKNMLIFMVTMLIAGYLGFVSSHVRYSVEVVA